MQITKLVKLSYLSKPTLNNQALHILASILTIFTIRLLIKQVFSMYYNTNSFKEINKLNQFIAEAQILITIENTAANIGNLTSLNLEIKNKNYRVYIDDEYDDLKFNNKLLNLVLVFRALAEIDDSIDFLDWCHKNNLDPASSKLLEHYESITRNLETIKLLFPNKKIDYFISDLDFQINSGAIQLLRK